MDLNLMSIKMKKYFNKYVIVFILVAFFSISCLAQQSGYKLLKHEDMISRQDTFDIDYFEKNKNQGFNVHIYGDNEEHIWQYFSEEVYTEVYTPPLPKFYRGEREYYNNGKLKQKGYYMDELKIGLWEYYDEKGNKTTENMDLLYANATFDYNKVMQLLHKLGDLNLNTGENRENIGLHYYKEKNMWIVQVRNTHTYTIDGKRGKILAKGTITSE